eukprot:Sspe_Gene.18236::Locus_6542_Transcript_1_1_Confidence_1.000_Length_3053::g.18236::m.18236/K14424/SMO2; 4-alpha-methyl-delta7-sterol-4alpha-methyl oxidase
MSVAEVLLWNVVYLVRGSLLAAVVVWGCAPLWTAVVRGTSLSDRALFVCILLAVHEGLYFIVNGAFLALNSSGVLEKYRIPYKKDLAPTASFVRKTVVRTALGHFTVQPLVAWASFPVLPWRMDGDISVGLDVVGHLMFCQLFECFSFFVAHAALHYFPGLYVRYHKQHHEYIVTTGVAAEYAHPVEMVLANYVPVLTGPLLLLPDIHPLTFFVWLAWRLVATYERHSGYDFSSTPLGRIGLLHGHGSRYHALHHSANRGNFGSGLDLFDVLCGTRHYV